MTEVPEHLLARSRARRAGLSGAAVPETTGDAAPATTEAAAAPVAAAAAAPIEPAKAEPPAPKLPWVEAAESRRKIPVWAVSALIALPVWAIMYATTNDPQSPKEAGPLTTGATVYATCAACHGGAGQGGVGPALAGGDVVAAFPDPAAQVRWVMLGTAGYEAEGTATYGADEKPVGGLGVMPAQIDALTSEELLGVIRHERETLSGEEFDIEAWEAAAEELVADPNEAVATKAEEFAEIVESWKDLPAGS